MFKNYVKTTLRNLWKNKTSGFRNIFYLAAGTLCCVYIALNARDQYSYDNQHKNVKDIYRVATFWAVQKDKGNWATVTAPVAPAMKRHIINKSI